MSAIDWQDILVWGAILLAVSYLIRTRILPKLHRESDRRESGGCEKCGAHQAITERRGVKVKKLSASESRQMRSELNKR